MCGLGRVHGGLNDGEMFVMFVRLNHSPVLTCSLQSIMVFPRLVCYVVHMVIQRREEGIRGHAGMGEYFFSSTPADSLDEKCTQKYANVIQMRREYAREPLNCSNMVISLWSSCQFPNRGR